MISPTGAPAPPPSAELHIHIEGAIEAELLVRLAARNGVPLPSNDPEVLLARYDFADLQSFLDVHYANLAVLRTEQDFFELATSYLDHASAAGVKRAEPFFDPQTHLGHGVPLEAVFAGLVAAFGQSQQTHGISTDLIMCFLRDLGAEAAEEMFRAALPYREHFIGIGLDSTEIGYPPALFTSVYEMAAAEGLHRVAHAGEEAGPDYVWEAVDLLGVERIDHGLRAMEDPELVRRLRDDRIALTVCPLSNVRLRAVDTMADHSLPAMLDAGLLATVSSDDPAYFGGYADANYAAVGAELGFSRRQIGQLARNSFEAAFIGDEERADWSAQVADWESQPPSD